MGDASERAAASLQHARKRLEDKHRKIDAEIKDEELHHGDPMLIQRMKRYKLGMKDRIAKMGREGG